MNKEQEFAKYIANDVMQGIKAFKNSYVSSSFALKGYKQFQPFNWLELKKQCELLNIEISLNLNKNEIIAKPISF